MQHVKGNVFAGIELQQVLGVACHVGEPKCATMLSGQIENGVEMPGRAPCPACHCPSRLSFLSVPWEVFKVVYGHQERGRVGGIMLVRAQGKIGTERRMPQ